MTGVLQVDRFSTAGLDSARRIELWEQHNADALVGLSARTLEGGPLEATELTVALAGMRLGEVTANAHLVERSAAHIEREPSGSVALYFGLFGDAFFYHRDGITVQRPGDVVVCDADQPFARGFAHGLRELVLTVPRRLFDHLADVPLIRPVTMSFLDGRGGNAPAATVARLLRSSLTSSPRSSADVERQLIELLPGMFSGDPDRAATAHRRAALAYIERHAPDPRLGVEQVARAVGLSVRQLARVFAETGTSVARAILDRRLERAHRILSAPGSPSIGDVARQCGFASHAHFSRVYRERFGETPGRTRDALIGADGR